MTEQDRELGELRASITALRESQHDLFEELRDNERMTRSERAIIAQRLASLEYSQTRIVERLDAVEVVTKAVSESRSMVIGALVVLGAIGSVVTTLLIVAGEKIMHWLGIK